MPLVYIKLVYIKIIFFAETLFLLILLYIGRDFLKKRIKTLFGNTRIPRFYLRGFRLLLGILLMLRIYEASYGDVLFVRPSSFFRIDAILNFFFYSDFKFFLLIIAPLIFIALFVFEWKPRLTSMVVFLYSVIAGSLFHTIHGTLGQLQHKFHLVSLMLLGFAIYYWLFYKKNAKRSNERMIFPILLFFITTVYGASFMSKVAYLTEVPKWFTGEAIQSAIVKGHFQRILTYGDKIGELGAIPQAVAGNKPIASFFGIGGLLIEFASLFLLIASSKLRFVILVGLTIFHIIGGYLFLPSYFGETIAVHAYIVIWAAYNAFPRLK